MIQKCRDLLHFIENVRKPRFFRDQKKIIGGFRARPLLLGDGAYPPTR